jgi:hypothetical protein
VGIRPARTAEFPRPRGLVRRVIICRTAEYHAAGSNTPGGFRRSCCWRHRRVRIDSLTQPFYGIPNKGPYYEQTQPNPTEVYGGGCGVAGRKRVKWRRRCDPRVERLLETHDFGKPCLPRRNRDG